MSALAKSSMLLLPAIAIAVFSYIWVGDEDFNYRYDPNPGRRRG